MKGGTQAAVALGIGYLLGRRRRLRRAATLAAITATGSLSGASKALMSRGLKAVGSTELLGKLTPELGEIADTARTELLDAGKTAAMAMVTNRVESLSDSLRSRADVLKDPAATGGSVVDVLRSGGRGQRDERVEPNGEQDNGRSRRNDRDQDEYDEYEAEENGYEDEDAYDEDYAPAEDDEPGDEYDGDDHEEPDGDEPAPAPRRRARVSASPVSRAGR
jgi:hypothetical protein